MKPHLAFFNIPAHGHVNPTLAVVTELVKRGYRVTYATTEEFAPRVASAGATVVPLRSTMWAEPRVGPFSADDLARLPLKLLEETSSAFPELEAFYGNDRPALVLYDFMSLTGRILGSKWDVPCVQLCPTFAANEHFSIRSQLPAIDPTHPDRVEFANKLEAFLQREGIKQFSAGDLFQHVEKFQLVFLPRAFQFQGDTFDERFLFVGPCLQERPFQGGWEPPSREPPVLLISLGTVFNAWPEFFKLCFQAFSELPWHVVMSVGAHVDPARLGPVPRNFEVRASVPQLAVLRHARVFVSHAGMNSTMESLYYGVPLVAIPQMQEQETTARRLAELGLGTVLPRDETTVHALRRAVMLVAEDEGIATRVRDMQQRAREAGGAVRAADGIESYLKKVS